MDYLNLDNLKKIGFYNFFWDKKNKTSPTQRIARIVWQHSGFYEAIDENLNSVKIFLPGKLKHKIKNITMTPVVGDWVIIENRNSSLLPIVDIFPRFSALTRIEENNKKQILAANIDLIFIVIAADNSFHIKKLEEFINIASFSNIPFAIILNKIDLSKNLDNLLNEIKENFKEVEIFPLNSIAKNGYFNLKKNLKPFKTSVFIGPSGTGKSTIINNLYGKEIMKTSPVSTKRSIGRHTTTTRKLIILPNNHLIIDTPGIRTIEAGVIYNLYQKKFGEINHLAANCKFSDCKHYTEPGCAVKKAVESGEISNELYKEYLKTLLLNFK